MLKGEIFDETTAENVLAFSGKNRQQFVSYANDGTEDDGNSSEPKYEQVTKQDAPGSEYVLWKKKNILQRNWLGAVLLLLGWLTWTLEWTGWG